ncbi:hypothetical protein LTR66_015915, partial [Elasticomyces elasticus]
MSLVDLEAYCLIEPAIDNTFHGKLGSLKRSKVHAPYLPCNPLAIGGSESAAPDIQSGMSDKTWIRRGDWFLDKQTSPSSLAWVG